MASATWPKSPKRATRHTTVPAGHLFLIVGGCPGPTARARGRASLRRGACAETARLRVASRRVPRLDRSGERSGASQGTTFASSFAQSRAEAAPTRLLLHSRTDLRRHAAVVHPRHPFRTRSGTP